MVDFDRQPEFESGLGRAPLLANQAIFVCYLFLVGGLSVVNAGIKLPMFQINEALQHLFRFDNSNLLMELFTSTDFIHNFTTVSGIEEGSAFCLLFVMLLNAFVLMRVFAVAAKFSIDKVCMAMVCFLASLVYLPLSLQMSGWLERTIEVAKGAVYTMSAVTSGTKMATPIGKIILGDVSSVWLDSTQQSPVTVLDVAASAVALCLIAAFIPLFFVFLRRTLFPKTIMRRGKRGLAVGAAGWRWILGDNLVNWEDIQLASVTREKGIKFFQLKTKNKLFKIEWEQLLKYIEPVELMSNLRTYSANAVDISCSVIDAPVGSDYTELWLKYFTTATSRDRTGMLQVGEKLHEGRYEVAGELGQGGQGTAYLASSSKSEDSIDEGTTIVLKEYILPVHRGEAIFQHSIRKLKHEAEILGKIDHPNIVSIKDTFIEDHRGYLVLEFVDGRGLKQLVQGSGIQPEKLVIDIAIQVCGVLEHLHGMEPPIIHRDLTPDNLILQPDGKIKLVDFNVAHQLEANAAATVVGKHAYIPPEQFRGKPCPQSDIFALGGTMFYLLTGTEPEPLTVSHPRLLNPEVSEPLDQIIAKSTMLDAKDRYPTATSMRESLENL